MRARHVKTSALAMLPWRPITQRCRDDATNCGTCYCGGVISSTFAAEQPEHAAQRGIVIVPEAAGA